MKKKSKIVIARIMAVLMVLSILPFDSLTTANVVMAEELENVEEPDSTNGGGDNVDINAPVSIGGIEEDEGEPDASDNADGSGIQDDKDNSNPDGSNESDNSGDSNNTGDSGDSNDSDNPDNSGNTDNGDGSNDSGTTGNENGDTQEGEENTKPSTDDGVNNGEEPDEPSKSEETGTQSGEGTAAKTYILDPQTMELSASQTSPVQYGTEGFFTVMATSGKGTSISNIDSIKTGNDSHEAYKPLNWGEYANEKLGNSNIANSERTKCLSITGGTMAPSYACVKIETKYPNARLVVYGSPKDTSASISVKTLNSKGKFEDAFTGGSISNPKVGKNTFTLGEAGVYYVGFSARGGIILYMEVTDDPNATESDPGAGNTAGVTFTYDPPVMGVKTSDVISFIKKSDEVEGQIETAEAVTVENIHLKAEALTESSPVITADIKAAVTAECTKLMEESDNKDAGAKPIVSYYDMSLVNKDAGVEEADSALQIKEGMIKFKLPYPNNNVSLANKIVIMHEKEVIGEVERANKDSDGFWVEAESFSPYTVIIEPTENPKEGKIVLTDYSGYAEGAYVEWKHYTTTAHNGYMVAVSKDNQNWSYIDDELIRKYPTYFRADALGLTKGTWYMKVEAVTIGTDKKATVVAENTVKLNVTSHDRSGYGWVGGTSSGAYAEDGSLLPNANVVYITETTKDTVELNVTGATTNPCVGLQGILDGYKKGKEASPLAVRIIGNITDPSYLLDGDVVIENSNSGNKGMGGITFEGVGEDAVVNGWGVRVKNASNVEIRNLAYMNCDSKEGDNIGLQQGNDHIWVHNCDMFYGDAGSDADQVKGDGALDCKKSTYVTLSYNHFWDSGKCSLLGMKDESNDEVTTYHHNWFDHSDSRHPRVRTYTTHIYNNYYDGNSKYGVGGALGGGSIFVENNYFRNCKYPMLISMQGSDIYNADGTFSSESGSMIKAYGNIISGAKRFIAYSATDDPSTDWNETTDFDAYVASDRNEKVPENVKTLKGGFAYSNFDTAADFYTYTPDATADVPEIVRKGAGRVNGGDLKYTFDNATADTSYAVDMNLKKKCVNYTSELLSVGGTNGVSVNIEYTVTFDPNNGEDSYDETVASGATVTEPATDPISSDPSKTFAGWYKGGNVKWNFSNIVQGNMTLVAIYLGEDEDPPGTGGGDDDGDDDIGGDDVIVDPSAYVHNFTTQEKDSQFYTITGNISNQKGTVIYNGLTLTKSLKMEGSSVQVSFVAPVKGTLKLVFNGDNTSAAGKRVKINGITKNCDNNGIYTQEVAAGETIQISKGDAINLYYIEYSPEAYYITINKDDGSANKTIPISKGSELTKDQLPDPERIGYEFTGWIDESNNPVTLPFKPTGNMTLTATWNEVKYTITINRDNGSELEPMEVGKGDKIKFSNLGTPERTGHIFKGWVDADTNEPITLPYEPTKDMTIKATWEKEEGSNPDPNNPSDKDSWTVALKENPDPAANPYTYTGSNITPEFTVYGPNGKVLVEGSDYTVKYSNNKNVSVKAKADGSGYTVINAKKQPTITITGKGVITGKHTVTFGIKPKDISKALAETNPDKTVAVATIIIETGKKPTTPVICYNGVKLTAKDYKYKDNKDKTKTTFADGDRLYVEGQGNYVGELGVPIKVVAKGTLKDNINKFKVDIDSTKVSQLIYNEAAQDIAKCIKAVTPTSGSSKNTNILTQTDKYTVLLPNNVTDAGTVKFMVVGLAEYSGCTVSKSVKIQPRTITGKSSGADSSALDKVTITGADESTYTSAGAVLDNLKVEWNGKELVNGKDYKVSYSGNKAATSNGKKAKYTISFKGNFKGKLKGDAYTFTVAKAKLNKSDTTINVEIPDKVCKDNANCKSAPYVTINGVLVKASEYEVTYSVGSETGTYGAKPKVTFGSEPFKKVFVKIKAKTNSKNYMTDPDQELTGISYIVWKKDAAKKDISKAKVTFYNKATGTDKKKVTKLDYTGAAVEPVFMEVKLGNDILTKDVDYTVKYVNNINKGKATVIIKAVESSEINKKGYIGGKTQTFSIVSRNIKNNALAQIIDSTKVKSVFDIFNW